MESSIFVHFVVGEGDVSSWMNSIAEFMESRDPQSVTYKRDTHDPERQIRLRSDSFSARLSSIARDHHPFNYDGRLLRISRPIDHHFEADKEGFDAFCEFVRIVYEATEPRYGFGMLSYHVDALDVEQPQPVSDAALTQNRIEHPTWLMAFSPPFVEEYGREWLDSLPIERIEEFSDGGVLTVATSDVTDGTAVYEAMQELEAAWE